MRRLILKSVFPTIQEAKETVLFNEFYVEIERGWIFFESQKDADAWIAMIVHDYKGPL